MTGEKGLVFDISHFMTEDGPGIRTSVFMKGCPLRCKWCSNAYGLSPKRQLAVMKKKCGQCGKCIDACPAGAVRRDDAGQVVTDFSICVACGKCVDACLNDARTIVGTEYTADEVMAQILEDKDFYRRNHGGATFSGGEILMQAPFVREVLRRCREASIHTAIETSGYGCWENLESLLEYSDFVFMDIKAVDPNQHKELTGRSNAVILANIRRAVEYCGARQIPVVLRLPLIPGLNDGEEAVCAVARYVKSLPYAVELNVLPYHALGVCKYDNIGQEYALKGVQKNSCEQIAACRKILDAEGINYSVGGANVHLYTELK